MDFLSTAAGGTASTCLISIAVLGLVMWVVDWRQLSNWLTVAAALGIIMLAALVPDGWSYLQLTFSERPPIGLLMSDFSAADYLAFAKYRFWGSLVGCTVGLVGYEYLKKQYP